jgi:hypothetical protein
MGALKMASKSFLEQTARDYDLPYHIVEAIYKRVGAEKFYDELEAELVRRAYSQKSGRQC